MLAIQIRAAPAMTGFMPAAITKGLTTGIMAPPKAMLDPMLVRIIITIMVKININSGPLPANKGSNIPVSQGRIPVASLVMAVARGIVIAHIMMTGQLTAASECLISLNTMAAFWSPSPLGRTCLLYTSIEKTGGAFLEIPDRREAIEYSISHAMPGDMIAVIGKGHEDYQEINGVRHHFLDREVIEEVVGKLGEEA